MRRLLTRLLAWLLRQPETVVVGETTIERFKGGEYYNTRRYGGEG